MLLKLFENVTGVQFFATQCSLIFVHHVPYTSVFCCQCFNQ